jgi:hypothetical protein
MKAFDKFRYWSRISWWTSLAAICHLYVLFAAFGFAIGFLKAIIFNNGRTLLIFALLALPGFKVVKAGTYAFRRAKKSTPEDRVGEPYLCYSITLLLLLILFTWNPFSPYSLGILSSSRECRFSPWVRVLDQHGVPIPSLGLQGSLAHSDLFTWISGASSWGPTSTYSAIEPVASDRAGYACVSSGWKRGYALNFMGSSPSFQEGQKPYPDSTFVRPRYFSIGADYREGGMGTMENPFIYRLFRITEPCATLLRYSCSLNPYEKGMGVSWDVSRGELQATREPEMDLFFKLEPEDPEQEGITPSQSLIIQAGLGCGVQLASDEFLLETPDRGYQDRIVIHLREEWRGIEEQTEDVYFYTDEGAVYGALMVRLALELYPPMSSHARKTYGKLIRVNCTANPAGSRNLLPCTGENVKYALPLALPISDRSPRASPYDLDMKRATRAPSLQALGVDPKSTTFLVDFPEQAPARYIVWAFKTLGPAGGAAEGFRRILPPGYIAFEGEPPAGAISRVPNQVLVMKTEEELDALHWARPAGASGNPTFEEIREAMSEWNQRCGLRITKALSRWIAFDLLHPDKNQDPDSILNGIRALSSSTNLSYDSKEAHDHFRRNLERASPESPLHVEMRW